MLKYLLIFGGILVSFLNDIIVKEKDDKNESKLYLKKYTKIGLFTVIFALLISSSGLYLTYKEDEQNKSELFLKTKKDSIIFAQKNSNDSLRFMAIIKELSKNQSQVLTQTDNILSSTLKESKKLMIDGYKNKFIIPEQFFISFKAEFDLDKINIQKTENEIFSVYSKYIYEFELNNNKKFDGSLGLDFFNYSDKTFEDLYYLFKLSEGQIITTINFLNNDKKKVLKIFNNDNSSLKNGKTPFSKPNDNFIQNTYNVQYDYRNKKFFLHGFDICLNSERTQDVISLIDLQNKVIQIEISVTSSDKLGGYKSFKLKKIIEFSLHTKDGLSLKPNIFEVIDSKIGTKFQKKLINQLKWE